MATGGHIQQQPIAGASRLSLGAHLLALSGVGLVGYGIKNGERWALLTAFLSPVIAVAVALSLHFPYGIGTLGHLGLIYFDALILAVGTAVAYFGLPERDR